MLRPAWGLALFAVALAACGDRTELSLDDTRGSSPPEDGGRDAAHDGGTRADVAREASRDGRTEASVDGGPECKEPRAYVWYATGELALFDPHSFAVTSIGTPSCGAGGDPWTLSASLGGSLFLVYQDWNIYKVDLADLHCEKTGFDGSALGFTIQESIAVSRSTGAEKLYVYGVHEDGSAALAVADLDTLAFTAVGPVLPDPMVFPADMQSNQHGTLYAISDTGRFVQIRESDAKDLDVEQANFEGPAAWALMTYGADTYLFSSVGLEVTVSRYDVGSNTVTPVTQLEGQGIVGASSVPCP